MHSEPEIRGAFRQFEGEKRASPNQPTHAFPTFPASALFRAEGCGDANGGEKAGDFKDLIIGGYFGGNLPVLPIDSEMLLLTWGVTRFFSPSLHFGYQRGKKQTVRLSISLNSIACVQGSAFRNCPFRWKAAKHPSRRNPPFRAASRTRAIPRVRSRARDGGRSKAWEVARRQTTVPLIHRFFSVQAEFKDEANGKPA
jgi:hypothetical protein